MEHAVEHRGKRFANAINVLQRQRRIAQLAILQLSAHQLFYKPFNRLRRRIWHGTHRGFDGVRQHDNGAFLAGRPRSIIAEVRDIHSFSIRLLQRLMVEEHHRRIAMVLHNNLLNLRGQVIFLRQLQAVPGMGRNNGRRNIGIGAIVRVFSHLIFLEIQRPLQFANIMEVGARARKQRICANFFCCRLGQVGHHNRMVICARSLNKQPTQKRLIGISQLQKLAGRSQIKHGFNHRLKANRQHAAEHTANHAPDGVVHHDRQVCGCHQSHCQHHAKVHQRHHKAAQYHAHALRPPLQEMHRYHAADQRGEHQVHQLR